eukprot:12842309-Ditylum_brightwellii.AAC.1
MCLRCARARRLVRSAAARKGGRPPVEVSVKDRWQQLCSGNVHVTVKKNVNVNYGFGPSVPRFWRGGKA